MIPEPARNNSEFRVRSNPQSLLIMTNRKAGVPWGSRDVKSRFIGSDSESLISGPIGQVGGLLSDSQ